MNKRFLNFLHKYRICFLLILIMYVGFYLSARYSYLYKSNSEIISFNLHHIYCIFVIPLLSLVYGVLSYIFSKKIWIPQIFLFAMMYIVFWGYEVICYGNFDAWIFYVIWSVILVIISLIGTAIVNIIKQCLN